MSRETFLTEMVEGLTAVLESALGTDIAASCINSIGLAVGMKVDEDYKRATGLSRPLNADEYCGLIGELLGNLYGEARASSPSPDLVEVEVMSSASPRILFAGQEIGALGASIFGAIAALNFGYAKVCKTLENRQFDGDNYRIRIFLSDSPDARLAAGEEFHPEIVQAFGDVQTQLKVVEENRMLREQLREAASEYRARNRQISAAAEIAGTVSQSLDPLEILSAGLQMLLDSIGVEVGAVFRIDDVTDELEISHQHGISREDAIRLLWGEVLPAQGPPGRPRWVSLLAARRHSPPGWRTDEFQCYASAPMRAKEQPIGVVILFARLRRAFAPLEMELLELVANELGVGLENIRLYDHLAHQVKRLTDLREISVRLNRCNQLGEVLNLIAESVTRRLGFDRVGIFLITEDNYLEQVRGTDEHGNLSETDRLRIPIVPESGTLARAVLEQKPLHVLDLASEADIELSSQEVSGLQELHISAFARVPLIAEDRVVGVISVDNMIRRRPITHDDLNMLMILGGQAAVAIDNARFTEALQRSAEELRRVDAVRSEFVSMISHEFRSPLHKIRNAGSLLAEDETDPQRAKFARAIVRSTDYLTSLVNNLLAQSRMEQAALRLEQKPTALARVLSETVQEMRSAALPPEQVVEIAAPESIYVAAEEAYLKLILVNLISNASKASARDGRIDIRAEETGGWVQICVQDYGVGIPVERQESIFERFVTWRPDGSQNVSGGVGLGLYICRSLVEAHGGRIWLTSEPGHGSDFCFTLRAVKPSAAPSPPAETPVPASAAP